MKVKYYDFPEATISDDKIKMVLEPPSIAGKDEGEFKRELQSLLEEELVLKVSGARSLLLLVDDVTRQTPTSWILPIVMDCVSRCGIEKDKINILVATGTHRPMTLAEQIKKYGESVVKIGNIKFHNYKSDVINIGSTNSGVPVSVNKLVLDYDFILGIGSVIPHRVAGFSGGGKIVQPGISGEETTGQTHWLSAKYEGREILGKIENPVRDEIEEVAKIAGLDFIINVVPNSQGKPVSVFAGDPLPTFQEAARFAKKHFSVKSKTSKIVITDSFPADLELWQAAKGIYSGDLVLQEGGVLILVTPCPEGVGVEFGDLVTKLGYRGHKDVERLVESGELDNLIVAAHLVHVGRVIKDKGVGIIVSHGIKPELAKKIGFIPARTLADAIDVASSIVGPEDVIICRCGGGLLPVSSEN